MENERCGSKGWTRVALVDMYDNAQPCPGDLTLISSPIRTCGGPTTAGCASAKFPTHGMSYSQVCGRLRGYQVGQPNAFGPYLNDQTSLDLVIDGVLISHGKTQKHIWAYATGHQKNHTADYNSYCPCADYRFNGIVPSFIGNDYYCDSGVQSSPEFGKFTLHHCGLVKDVLLQTSAAPIAECRGFVRLYLFPLLTTLRYVTVIIMQ